ncbi:MAG: hypothetical protein ABIT83_20145 [Massilia sp.]
MAAVLREVQQEAIFENAGQAVHVAFLIMAQPATQDAPLRMALIRIMESIKLESKQQRHWLDQLRGGGDGTVNFSGLSGGDIRAQCAMITQAVKTKLPNVEMWVLQAKYGQTDFEDVSSDQDGDPDLLDSLVRAKEEVRELRAVVTTAADVLDCARHDERLQAIDALNKAKAKLTFAGRKEQLAQVAYDRTRACKLVDNGPAPKDGKTAGRRRYAFSPERIDAIQGLSDWFAPMFPRIKPLAIDCMLGRLFANHKKIDISARDLAASFGGSYSTYLRASWKMKNHLRELEERAIARLEPIFLEQGVCCGF